MSSLSKVVIAGRMNVGKSTLFNRLAESIKSITYDYEGVTRDVIKDTVHWKDRLFEIIDTGGISLRPSEDPLQEEVRQRALSSINNATVVLLVVDGRAGILAEDEEIAQTLRQRAKNVILVVNKADTTDAQDSFYNFYKLVAHKYVLISAQHGIGISDLLDEIMEYVPPYTKSKEPEKPDYKVVFLGRPNVGKSSLLNALLGENRAIVSDIPGTTREALIEKLSFYKEHLQIADTPGIRRSRSIEGEIEPLMVRSAFQAVRESDIVVMIIDLSQSEIVSQELKLAFYAFTELHKALILLVNKVDLEVEEMQVLLDRDFEEYNYFLKKIPILRISCKTGKNIGKILPLIKEVKDRYTQDFCSAEIKRIILTAAQQRNLMHTKIRLEVRDVKIFGTAPLTIGLKVNYPEWFEKPQLLYFENVLREHFDLRGVPIKFIARRKL